ncbi:MAG: isoprenylcysteine carboxylmethyltransferase family protein [Methylobacterium mesophilicum]|nr:isoprenylcysteine carboxylmethyltransferase family protein [Methylobacterium mesophilicum]
MERYQRIRRAAVAALFAVVVGILVFGRSAASGAHHEYVEMAGTILIVLGIGGRLWSTLYIGGRKSAEVVSTGPYSITRNPLYVFSAIAAAGAGAQMGSVLASLILGLLCVAAFHLVIFREEDYLRARLGQTYEDYCARVPRFLPKFSLYRDQDEVTFRPRLLRNTLRDGLVFFASLPLFELIEMGQRSGVIPVLFHLS